MNDVTRNFKLSDGRSINEYILNLIDRQYDFRMAYEKDKNQIIYTKNSHIYTINADATSGVFELHTILSRIFDSLLDGCYIDTKNNYYTIFNEVECNMNSKIYRYEVQLAYYIYMSSDLEVCKEGNINGLISIDHDSDGDIDISLRTGYNSRFKRISYIYDHVKVDINTLKSIILDTLCSLANVYIYKDDYRYMKEELKYIDYHYKDYIVPAKIDLNEYKSIIRKTSNLHASMDKMFNMDGILKFFKNEIINDDSVWISSTFDSFKADPYPNTLTIDIRYSVNDNTTYTHFYVKDRITLNLIEFDAIDVLCEHSLSIINTIKHKIDNMRKIQFV